MTSGWMDDAAIEGKVGFWIGVGKTCLQVCWRWRLWHCSIEGSSQNWAWRVVVGGIAIGRT